MSSFWAEIQKNLGFVLIDLGIHNSGEEGRKQLQDAAMACRCALEVYTKEEAPIFWAETQNNLGDALRILGSRTAGEAGRKQLEDAVNCYRCSLEIYTETDAPQVWVDTLIDLGRALGSLSNKLDGEEGLKLGREAIESLRKAAAFRPDDPTHFQLVNELGDLAFKLILNREFVEAQLRCEEAQKLASEIGAGIPKTDRDDLIFIEGNLAHALLFQGRYDEALTIYRQYWEKPLLGKTFGRVTLDDLAAFDKAGLTHPDLSRMRQVLTALQANASNP
jgi:tetratricopeptide (TPR) repeat protein